MISYQMFSNEEVKRRLSRLFGRPYHVYPEWKDHPLCYYFINIFYKPYQTRISRHANFNMTCEDLLHFTDIELIDKFVDIVKDYLGGRTVGI